MRAAPQMMTAGSISVGQSTGPFPSVPFSIPAPTWRRLLHASIGGVQRSHVSDRWRIVGSVGFWARLLLVLTLVAAALGGCGGSSKTLGTTSTSASPATTRSLATPVQTRTLQPLAGSPASRQLEWVISALNHGSAPSPAELRQRFSAAFLHALEQAGGVAAFEPVAAQAPLRIAGVLANEGSYGLQAELTTRAAATLRVTIAVSPAAPHLIQGLLFAPLALPITSWSAVDAALARLAAHASLYAGYAAGGELHGLNATEPGAIGSAFKLYVLGALADAVGHGRVRWDTPLAIHEDWKSLPSGNMRLRCRQGIRPRCCTTPSR